MNSTFNIGEVVGTKKLILISITKSLISSDDNYSEYEIIISYSLVSMLSIDDLKYESKLL